MFKSFQMLSITKNTGYLGAALVLESPQLKRRNFPKPAACRKDNFGLLAYGVEFQLYTRLFESLPLLMVLSWMMILLCKTGVAFGGKVWFISAVLDVSEACNWGLQWWQNYYMSILVGWYLAQISLNMAPLPKAVFILSVHDDIQKKGWKMLNLDRNQLASSLGLAL